MNITKVVPNLRLAFSDNLVVAKALAGGKPRFTANFIIESPESLKLVQDAINQIAKEEFGGKAPTGKDSCLRDGNDNISGKTQEVYDGFAGKFYISGSRAEKLLAPKVVDGRLNDVRPGDKGYPNAGDYVTAKLSFYSINGKNDKGGDKTYGKKICCTIEVVQFIRKGESFGSAAPSVDGMTAAEDSDEIDAL